LYQHRAKRFLAAEVGLAQLASLGVSGLGIREQIGEKQSKRGLSGAVRAGQGPGPGAAFSPEFLQDLSGESQQCGSGQVVARIVRRFPVVGQMYRTMESPADVHVLIQCGRREFAPIHVPSIP
jgi:hypothetical protein